VILSAYDAKKLKDEKKGGKTKHLAEEAKKIRRSSLGGEEKQEGGL